MRLLLVIDCLSSGGAQRQLVNLAVGLRERGHEVHVFVYHAEPATLAPELHSAGVHVQTVRKRSRLSVAPVLALRRLVGAGGFDGVVSFLETPAVYAELACLGAGRPPLVVSLRNLLPPGGRGRLGRWLRRGTRVAAHVTTNAHHVRSALTRDCPWLDSRTTTIWNGVDLERFRPLDASPSGGEPELRLLALGSVIRRKNPVALVRGLARYRERFGTPVPHVTWAGRGEYSSAARACVQETKSELEATRLETSWTWLGEVDDAQAQLARHDALVHPGAREGFPNAIGEALAAGRPVLASRACEHPRLVEDGVRGFLFDPEEPDEIADALHRLSRSTRAEREQMGKAARAFAEAHLARSRCVDEYESLLCGLGRP